MKILDGDPTGWRGSTPDGSAVTIGVFDGVHLGHKRVLAELSAFPHPTVVVTFDTHPLQVVAPDAAPRLLTSLEQRIDLFGELGIDAVAVLPFREVRNLGPEEFVRVVLVEAFAARVVAVGTDFRFGLNRMGDVVLLGLLGERHGFRLQPVHLLEGDDGPISSTSIRIMVASGRVSEAAAALGRLFELRGVVTRGEGRGRELGIPTANLAIGAGLLTPGHGVYAAWANLGRGPRPAAVNVGIRPTFGKSREVVEAHVLDFEGDLYGERISVRFHSRIRDEQAFEGIDALLSQVRRDIEETRRRLESPDHA